MKPNPIPFLVLGVMIFSQFACSLVPGSTPAEPQKADTATTQKVDTSTMLLPDPAQGLDNLKSYHSVLKKEFSGKFNGKDIQSHFEMTDDGDKASGTELIDLKQIQEDGTKTQILQGVSNGAFYSRNGDEESTCQVTRNMNAETPVFIRPVDLLPMIDSAVKIGTETIENTTVVHYALDENSLAYSGAENIKGDLWLAEQGGYVVKLNLNITGGEETFGESRRGTQSLYYELTKVNNNGDFALPAGCSAVLIDIPVLTDATNIHRYPDLMKYETVSPIETILKFYKEKLGNTGWISSSDLPYQGEGKIIMFINKDKPGSILLDIVKAEKGGFQVTVSTLQSGSQQTKAAGQGEAPATAQPETPFDPARAGLPEDVQVYPGAKDFTGVEGMQLAFHTTDPEDKVKTFYETSLKKAGWIALPGTEKIPGAPLMFQKGGSMIFIQLSADAGGTRVVITKAK